LIDLPGQNLVSCHYKKNLTKAYHMAVQGNYRGPTIRGDTLTWQDGNTLREAKIGTPEFVQWLVRARDFRYFHPEAGWFMARREVRRNADNFYWYAVRPAGSRSYRLNMGAAFDKNGDLRFTAHYLESIARELGQKLSAFS
jgi:hypothetical protein